MLNPTEFSRRESLFYLGHTCIMNALASENQKSLFHLQFPYKKGRWLLKLNKPIKIRLIFCVLSWNKVVKEDHLQNFDKHKTDYHALFRGGLFFLG